MKRPEYVAVVTGVYARALKEGRSPTQAELDALYLRWEELSEAAGEA